MTQERLKQDAAYYAEVAGIPVQMLLRPITDFDVKPEGMSAMVAQVRLGGLRHRFHIPGVETFEQFSSRVGCFNRNQIDARLYTVQELARMADRGELLECEVLALHSVAQGGLSERDYTLFLSMLEQAQKQNIHLLYRLGALPVSQELRTRLKELT